MRWMEDKKYMIREPLSKPEIERACIKMKSLETNDSSVTKFLSVLKSECQRLEDAADPSYWWRSAHTSEVDSKIRELEKCMQSVSYMIEKYKEFM